MLAQILTVARFESRSLFRKRRTVFSLFLYLTCIGLFLASVTYLQEEFDSVLAARGVTYSQVSHMLMQALEETGVASSEQAQQILEFLSVWPAPLWLFQILSIFLMPSLIALVSSDAITIDVYRRTLRYVLLKCDRTAYVMGKVVAHAFFYLLTHAFSLTLLFWCCSPWERYGGVAAFLGDIVLSFAVFVPFLFVAVAITVWISSCCSRPAMAALAAHGFWVLALAIIPYQPEFTPLNPELLVGMLFPEPNYRMGTIGGYGIWLVTVLSASIIMFRFRDV